MTRPPAGPTPRPSSCAAPRPTDPSTEDLRNLTAHQEASTMTDAETRTGSTYGRCPIPGASPATLEVTAWHNFTGPEAEMREALGDLAGPAHARVKLKHACGWSLSTPPTAPWTYVQQAVAEHFGPAVNPDDEEYRRRELRAALTAAAGQESKLAPPEVRKLLVDRLAPMVGRREADAAAAGLEAVRTQLAHHGTEQDDPCQDRGGSWPCDVALALWPDAAAGTTATTGTGPGLTCDREVDDPA